MKEESQPLIFEILVGTYEEFLLGYKFYASEDGEFKLEHTIAEHAHKGSLRALDSHGPNLASGGVDEFIHVYNLKERRECGMLTHHNGTITCVKFTPDGSYLVTCSEDGAIGMLRVGNWVLEKMWSKAHKGSAVHHLCIHPTGKLALSLGADSTLKTWNLVKGRVVYTINLFKHARNAQIIEWSQCGDYFGLVNCNKLDLYSVSKAGVERSLALPESNDKISCIKFLEGLRVVLGSWNGFMICFDFLTGKTLWTLCPHKEIRIKTLACVEKWLVAANSQGNLMVFELGDNTTPKQVAQTETNCRITCMTLSCLASEPDNLIKRKKAKKRKAAERNSMNDSVCSSGGQKWTVTPLDS